MNKELSAQWYRWISIIVMDLRLFIIELHMCDDWWCGLMILIWIMCGYNYVVGSHIWAGLMTEHTCRDCVARYRTMRSSWWKSLNRAWVKVEGDSTCGWKSTKESPLDVSCLLPVFVFVVYRVSPASGVGSMWYYWPNGETREVVALLMDTRPTRVVS